MFDKNSSSSTVNTPLSFKDRYPHITLMVNDIKIENASDDFGYEFQQKYKKFNINNGWFVGYINKGIANSIRPGKQYCFWFSYLGTNDNILIKMFLETQFAFGD